MDLFFLLTKIEAYLENVAINQWQRFVEDGIIEIDNDALLHEAVDYVCQYDVRSIFNSLDAILESKEAIAAIDRMFDDMTLMVTEFAEDAAEWNRASSHGIPGILRYYGMSVGDFV